MIYNLEFHIKESTRNDRKYQYTKIKIRIKENIQANK